MTYSGCFAGIRKSAWTSWRQFAFNLKSRICAVVLPLAASVVSGFSPLLGAAPEPCPRVEFGVFHEQRLESTRPVRDPKGRTIFFEQTPITRLHDILRIQYGTDKATLLVSLKADAAGRLKTATTKNSGLRLAFVVEDEAVMAVVWEGDYGIDNGEMQLSFRDEDLARKLVTTISSCIRTRPE